MKKIEEIKKIIKNCKPTLEEEFNVKNIGVFGSYTQGEADKDSDIDILVEFKKPIGFFAFIELEEFLEKKLKEKVDLVTKKSLKPAIGKRILKQVSYI
ncbi:MAG: nucleotidyltransferase family protein [Minisyncoccales bacterium]